MGSAERREREREQLRTRIIEAARDLLSEQGLGGLSMRAIADRIEYSPAAIYLYFRDKDELVHEVVTAGFALLQETMAAQVGALAVGATALDRYRAMGRAYARFALEHTAYFRVMFELPATAHAECPSGFPAAGERAHGRLDDVVATLEEASSAGHLGVKDARRAALIGWGLIHGLTSLYLSGQLGWVLNSHEEFLALIEDAMSSMYAGWKPSAAPPAVRRA